MKSQAHTSEAELSQVVLKILSERETGEATFSELVSEIPRRIILTASDRQQSTTRNGEEIWEQRVRNITSHKNTSGNIIADGYAESIPGGLRITEAGRSLVNS